MPAPIIVPLVTPNWDARALAQSAIRYASYRENCGGVPQIRSPTLKVANVDIFTPIILTLPRKDYVRTQTTVLAASTSVISGSTTRDKVTARRKS